MYTVTLWAALLVSTIIAVAPAINQAANNQEKLCDCNVANYWLDVVIAIDVSLGMSSDGIVQVAANAYSLFVYANISQTIGQTTRIAIVPYASEAYTYADLFKYDSMEEFAKGIYSVPASNDVNSDINSALNQAQQVLSMGRRNDKRNNVPQLVIIYAAEFNRNGKNDPLKTADRIKADGISIITVDFNQGGGVNADFSKVASPGMNFESSDNLLVDHIQQAMCQVNCFCPNDFTQFIVAPETSGALPISYSSCVLFAQIPSNWVGAQMSCHGLYPGAYLASELSRAKHDFLVSSFTEDPTVVGPPYSFFIGLSYNSSSSSWQWEQGYGKQKLMLSTSTYDEWKQGFPMGYNINGCAVESSIPTMPMGWENQHCYADTHRYVCQVDACDTSKYCSFI